MWLGLALVVWLWGLALYLGAYSFAGWYWRGRLYEVLGQDFYNAHIPGGGWEAALVPTIVFLITLAVVGVARRPIAAAAGWLERKTRLPPRAGLAACNLALFGLTIPAAHAAVVGTREGIAAAIARSRREAAVQREAERRARDPFYTGAGMQEPVAFSAFWGMGGQRLIVGADGVFRRTTWGCVGGDRLEGRFERRDDLLEFESPPPEFEPYSPPLIRLREVRWGERRYLLPDSDRALLGFCNAVNSGEEPVTGRVSTFLMRDGDEGRPATGLPAVPDSWTRFLLADPLEGHTVEENEDGTAWTDLGSDLGVQTGMCLWLPSMPLAPEIRDLWGGSATTIEPVEVVEVETRRCRVSVTVHPVWTVPAGLVVTSRKPQRP